MYVTGTCGFSTLNWWLTLSVTGVSGVSVLIIDLCGASLNWLPYLVYYRASISIQTEENLYSNMTMQTANLDFFSEIVWGKTEP